MPLTRRSAENQRGTAGYPGQTAATGPLGMGTGPAMNPAMQDTAGMHGRTAANGPGAYQQGMTHLPPQGVAGSDPYANTVSNNDVAPVQHFSSGQQTGTGSSTTGKIERVVGTVLCNPTLKAKGIEKERVAQAQKIQNVELAEAERLEHEATLRRERAVQHGKHLMREAIEVSLF